MKSTNIRPRNGFEFDRDVEQLSMVLPTQLGDLDRQRLECGALRQNEGSRAILEVGSNTAAIRGQEIGSRHDDLYTIYGSQRAADRLVFRFTDSTWLSDRLDGSMSR